MSLVKFDKCLGFDLGTTNSCVSIIEGSLPVIVQNQEGYNTTPSVVAYTGDHRVIVGANARNQAVKNVLNTFYATKRFIGRQYADKECQDAKRHVSYSVVEGPQGEALMNVPALGKQVSPIEIGSEVLKKLTSSVLETHASGEKPISASDPSFKPQAVITCPAYFNNDQRRATELAGKLAGLDVIRVLSEPTAAALLYNFSTSTPSLRGSAAADPIKEGDVFAVCDNGGGTYDVSILECSGTGVFSVLASSGDGFFGGEDWDNCLVDHILRDFVARNRHKLGVGPGDEDVARLLDAIKADPVTLAVLKDTAETIKIGFSAAESQRIFLPVLYNNLPYDATLTRKEFEALTAHLTERLIPPCRLALRDAGLRIGDISKVLLVGGSTRALAVQSRLERFFKKRPLSVLNPDESVSLGAAVQGAILNKSIDNILLLDVSPLSLGLEVLGGVFSPVIKRNTSIPTKKTQTFTNSEDSQQSVKIRVYQGEREIASQNHFLGEFELADLPLLPKGGMKIDITFEIDENGLVIVSAKEQNSGKACSIRIKNNSLTEEDVGRMLRNAEENRQKDHEDREKIEYGRELQALVAGLGQALQDNAALIQKAGRPLWDRAEKLLYGGRAVVDALGAFTPAALDAVSLVDIKKHRDRIQRVTLEIGEALYGLVAK